MGNFDIVEPVQDADLGEWQYIKLLPSKNIYFTNCVEIKPKTINMYMVSMKKQDTPFALRITNSIVKNECEKQGYSVSTRDIISEVLERVKCGAIDSLNCIDDTIILHLQLSEIPNLPLTLSLKKQVIKCVNTILCLMGSLNFHLIECNSIWRRQVIDRNIVIEKKDRVMGFLKDNIRDLGGDKLVERWAPRGSLNEQLMLVFEPGVQTNRSLADIRASNIDDQDELETTIKESFHLHSKVLKDHRSSKGVDCKMSSSEISSLPAIEQITKSPTKKRRVFGKISKKDP